MCGITGFKNFSQQRADGTVVHRMCDVMQHRGPDAEGILCDGAFAMGMRRLSIIDLSTGNQPIFNEDESVSVICNGEIYNFKELRGRLERRGHRFRTGSDAEVLVHLYEDHGDDFTDHINGMFAIAIWDTRTRRLVLARDRLGVKPLYYAHNNDAFVFGSEIKCVRQHPSVAEELDHQAVYDYFTLGYIPAPRTIYRNVRKLPAGTKLILEDETEKQHTYWEVPDQIDGNIDYDEAVDQIRYLLSDAVKLRMISDVPLGAFLSGGVDSSIVVALMAQLSDKPVKTFYIDFDEESHSERDYARSIARQFQTDHHEMVITPSATELLDKLVHHFDEPFADSSAIPTWYVSQMTRQHVTVALAGDGGDESFGGYDRYRRILARRNSPRLRQFGRPLFDLLADVVPRSFPAKRFIRSLGMDNGQFYVAGTDELETRQLLSPDFLRSVSNPISAEVNGLASHLRDCRDPLSPYTRYDLRWYLPDDILTKVDRMSMAHSLEVRGPFLDYRLVEFAAKLPHHWKINEKRGTKAILKDAFADVLPANILQPRKRGFSIPLADWLRTDLAPLLHDLTADVDLLDCEYFRMSEVQGLVKEHLEQVRDRSSQLWRILFFAHWLKTKNKQPSAA